MRRRRVGPARVPARLPLDRGSAVYSMIHPCTRIILLPPHHRLVNLIIHRACDASEPRASLSSWRARSVWQAGSQIGRSTSAGGQLTIGLGLGSHLSVAHEVLRLAYGGSADRSAVLQLPLSVRPLHVGMKADGKSIKPLFYMVIETESVNLGRKIRNQVYGI